MICKLANRFLLRLGFMTLALRLAFSAQAHDPGLSTVTARLDPTGIEVTLAFAVRDADQISPLDADGDGVITSAEFETGKLDLGNTVREEFVVQRDDVTISPTKLRSWLDSNNDTCLALSLPARTFSNLTFQARFLSRLPLGHRQYFTLRDTEGGSIGERLLSATGNSITIEVASNSSGQSDPSPAQTHPFAGFLVLGVEHILIGYDHLLFLFALLVVTSRFTPALHIITCFTLAHSLTLAVATFSTFEIPSRIVEPLIAASIVYVAIDNLVRGDDPKGRWLLTFAFGLIHGFGFASVLRELGVGANGAGITLPLLGFNLGVELGQIMVAAIALPAIWKFRTHPVFVARWVPAGSALVTLLGGYWFVERVWP